jgi:hypothetical protein
MKLDRQPYSIFCAQPLKIGYLCGKSIDMSREDKNRIAYYIACIGAFAERFSLSNAFAYNYLLKYSGLKFIYDCYESEHTLSIEDAVEDMFQICRRNGGELA